MKKIFVCVLFLMPVLVFSASIQGRPFGGRILLPDVPGVTCTDVGDEVIIRDFSRTLGAPRPMVAGMPSRNRFGQIVPGNFILGTFSMIRVPCINEQTGATIMLRRSRIHGTSSQSN